MTTDELDSRGDIDSSDEGGGGTKIGILVRILRRFCLALHSFACHIHDSTTSKTITNISAVFSPHNFKQLRLVFLHR